MTHQKLRGGLKDFQVFTLSDIRKNEPDFDRRRLNEWQRKGYIQKLRRGYYAFTDLPLSEENLFLIANRLYEPSYVSLEMALSRYGLIPESVYGITSITSKKTADFKTPLASFLYRTVKPPLLFGYRLENVKGQSYKIAEMEKSVLDYLYLNPHLTADDDFAGIRFNGEEFLQRADMKKFATYLAAFNNKSLSERARRLLAYSKNTN
jgi:predicted transcriptional regulator of viral defense system